MSSRTKKPVSKKQKDLRKRAEERLHLTVEVAPNAMIVVDREGGMVMMNTQTEKLFGYAREELLDRGRKKPEGPLQRRWVTSVKNRSLLPISLGS